MLFQKGQQVTCINTVHSSSSRPTGLLLGQKYTVRSMGQCIKCGNDLVFLEEFDSFILIEKCCNKCGYRVMDSADCFAASRFK